MARKPPAWGSKKFHREIRRHDRKFAKTYGWGAPPKKAKASARPTKGGCVVIVFAAGASIFGAIAAVRGWA